MRHLLTLPNQLTLLRLALLPVILILMLYGRHGLVLVLFMTAGISDIIDGVVARRFNLRTPLGAYLDPIADKLLLSSSFLVMSLIGSIPWWVTVLVLMRDLIILATSAVVALATPIRDFPPSVWGKLNTGCQVAAVFGVALRNAYPEFFLSRLASPAVWTAAASTVVSGVHYAWLTTRKLSRGGSEEPPASPDYH